MRRALLSLAAGLGTLVLAPAAPAAAPDVPDQVSYQGILLDTAGEPRSGTVDLTLRIFDALAGGTLIYKQVFTTVPLTDGVFSVRLGPQGAATDAPVDPLTTSLSEALAGDPGPASPLRFLEVTVGSEGALLRSQILSAPYALRAASADTAGSAAVADDVTSVNGLPSSVLNQLFEHGNADGGGPGNNDPLEGTQDTDGDGVMNFVDPDNDGDSIPDSTEQGDGSNLNLLTPTLSSLSPSTIPTFPPLTVTLSGLHFDPAMTVFLGSSALAATTVTPTSAVMQPPQGLPLGSFPVYVQLPNGERSQSRTLNIIASPDPGNLPAFALNATVSVGVRGAAKLLVANDEVYAVDFEEDGSVDGTVQFDELGNPAGGIPPQIAVAWGADGNLLGIRCKPNASGCQIQVIRDADADLVLSDAGGDDVIPGPSYSGTQLKLWGPSLASDASGNLVAGYVLVDDANNAHATVLHDRDGDGAFAPAAPETVLVQSMTAPGNLGSLAVDPAGRVAYAYLASGPALRVAYDRNGDGDYADTVGGTPETFTALSSGTHQGRFCGGVAFDAAGRLAAVLAEPLATPLRVLRDLNGDGDFSDGGDVSAVLGLATSACGIAGHPTGGVAVAHGGGGSPNGLQLLVDRNDDGDFADANETVVLGSGASRLGVAYSGEGRAWVVGTAGVFTDPF
jgi:hypothetical protein